MSLYSDNDGWWSEEGVYRIIEIVYSLKKLYEDEIRRLIIDKRICCVRLKAKVDFKEVFYLPLGSDFKTHSRVYIYFFSRCVDV